MGLKHALVHCTPQRFRKVARFLCGSAPLHEVLAGCSALHITLPGGSVNVAYHYVDSGVVELVAVQGATKRGSVLDHLPWLESRINGHTVQLLTRRRGLVRRLQRCGYVCKDEIAGVHVMQKELSHGRR